MCSWRIAFAALTACSALSAVQPAVAQDENSWRFAITPRVQYSFLNAFVGPGRVEEQQFPFYGGTIEVAPPGWRNLSFLVTVLNGTDYNLKGFDDTGQQISIFEFHRFDIEALARYRLDGTNVSLFGGFRHIYQSAKGELLDPEFFIADTGTTVQIQRIKFYLAEFGAGFSAPIDRSGQHSFFGNGIIGVGFLRDRIVNRVETGRRDFTLFAITFDVNAGYNWQFAACCALQARYRAFVFPAGNKTFKDLAVQHGPEIGLTFRFSLP